MSEVRVYSNLAQPVTAMQWKGDNLEELQKFAEDLGEITLHSEHKNRLLVFSSRMGYHIEVVEGGWVIKRKYGSPREIGLGACRRNQDFEHAWKICP